MHLTDIWYKYYILGSYRVKVESVYMPPKKEEKKTVTKVEAKPEKMEVKKVEEKKVATKKPAATKAAAKKPAAKKVAAKKPVAKKK